MSKFAANTTLFLSVISSAVAVAVLFGWDITEDQVAGLMALANSLIAVVALYFHPSVPVGPTEPPA